MGKPRRSFSVEQKLQIIREAGQQGTTQTLRKHKLWHSVFLRWKRQFGQGGSASTKPPNRKADPEVKTLRKMAG